MKKTITILLYLATALHSGAEDGHRLWLRYNSSGRAQVSAPAKATDNATVAIAVQELETYFPGKRAALRIDKSMPHGDGFRITGTADSIVITAHKPAGLLYAAYHALRAAATGDTFDGKDNYPACGLRLLNHWDNLDGSIERGYAGQSIFKWFNLDKRLIAEYARANASIGINGSVLNNVNASPRILTAIYLSEVKVIADILRPYGIRVYLSVNFAAPMALGYTETADPQDERVINWWKQKAKEIYRLIPDFGGFLVKANSEGQPGPGDYQRSHAEGANMLARAVRPYGGTIIWRSFVYGANHKDEDRVKQAVSEFKPCDGLFDANVILQSKNGPLDFQPREPYAPIFDQMKLTPQMAELQITQEYLGQSKHLVYLAPMWKEFFSFVDPGKLRGIAGVANIGNDRNWCGHHFSQANWYAFGRLAWNPALSSRQIACEWLKQTFSRDSTFVSTMAAVMESSREACVDYMMPLGLHHIFKFDHHYGPEPDGYKAEYPLEWCPVYYHRANTDSIGFDRSPSGSNAADQYPEPYRSLYGSVASCPEEYLLWFHRLPWSHRMKSGRTLWEELQHKYSEGVESAMAYQRIWRNSMRPYIDQQRWQEVDARLQQQVADAREWRYVCLQYFATFVQE